MDEETYERLRRAAAATGGDAAAALAMVPTLTRDVPPPGGGTTRGYLAALAGLGAGDLTVARAIEPHIDAVAILTQAELPAASLAPPEATWGVFAAEGPGVRLTATEDAGGWTLTGTKPWCSLANRLSHAVVTAHTGGGARRAFAVALRHPGVHVDDVAWASRGLVGVASGPVTFAEVPATPVGADDWYLTRPGFAWGGIGVAAVWYGAARALADRLRDGSRSRAPDQVAHVHLGAIDAALHAASRVLVDAARTIDAGAGVGEAGSVLAARVRAVCAVTAEDVLARVGHALGPGPLTFEEDHARRVADLTVYVRQHHAERDLARLGEMTLGGSA